MNCLTCNTIIPFGAKNCKNCGVDVSYMSEIEETKSSTSDTMLFVFICIALVSVLAQFIIQKFMIDWQVATSRYLQSFFWLLQNISLLLIPLAIKNKNLKTTGIIIAFLITSYWLYNNILFLIG